MTEREAERLIEVFKRVVEEKLQEISLRPSDVSPAAFEDKYMKRYTHGMYIDQALFRKYLREISLPSLQSSQTYINDLLSSSSSTYSSEKITTLLNGMRTKVINQTSFTATIQPNVLNVWGEMVELYIDFAAPSDTSIVNEYMVQFTSGANPTALSFPDSVIFSQDDEVVANKIYQISVVNNFGLIASIDV